MKTLNLKTTNNSPEQEALIFFTLALDEQLYDFTDDSFKAPALNTFSRILELQHVAQATHFAGIGKDALLPFIEELEWSVSKDEALSEQQRNLCKLHIAEIKQNTEPDRIARGVSGLRIVLNEYTSSIKNRITHIITQSPTHKKELISLSASFIVQSETNGFPRRHTFHVAQNSLIRQIKKQNFDPQKVITDFFSHFPQKNRKYSCLFVVTGEIENRLPIINSFEFSKIEDPPQWDNLTREQRDFLNQRTGSQHLFVSTDINAKSPAKARQLAINGFKDIVSIIRFFDHKSKFEINPLVIVLDQETKKTFHVHEAPDPMHCWVSHTKPNDADVLELVEATHGKRLTQPASNKLLRLVRFHRSALLSNSAENQLIDLWAGLEGLVSRPGKESVRIDYFSECLLPSLTLNYPEKIFLSAYCDFIRTGLRQETLAHIEGEMSDFAKFVHIVASSNYSTIRTTLCSKLATQQPLLLNRLWQISQLFKNRESVQKTLRQHRQKVKWHLARIYYTRNSIMHNASALPHLPTLVENLHVYIDTLVRSIQKTAVISPERLSIEGALQYISLWERYRLHSVTHSSSDNKADLTNSDLWDVIFGKDLALAPKINIEPNVSDR